MTISRGDQSGIGIDRPTRAALAKLAEERNWKVGETASLLIKTFLALPYPLQMWARGEAMDQERIRGMYADELVKLAEQLRAGQGPKILDARTPNNHSNSKRARGAASGR